MGDTAFDFNGQVAVVTGAATGIGRRAAERFAEAGAHVFLLDIDDAGGQAAAVKIAAAAGKADYLHCDLTQSSDVMPTFDRIATDAGRIDILVNSAGGFSRQLTIDETPEEEWDQVIARNLKSTFLTCKAAIPTFRGQQSGRIINIGSGAGQTVQVQSSPPYVAAKGGVHALTRALSFELGGDGITANTIAPGTTATDRVVAVRSEEQRARIGKMTHIGRIAEVDDIVGWILWLASPEASYMTGQTLAVNGGRLAV
jgi:3-oxoacyl-[acyl-carrier protein] reductase